MKLKDIKLFEGDEEITYTDFINSNRAKGWFYEDDWDGSGKIGIHDSNIESLKGIPKIIHGSFSIINSNLQTLKYFPEYVYGDVGITLNKTPINFIDIKKIETPESFVFNMKNISDLLKCKNVNRIVSNVKCKNLFFYSEKSTQFTDFIRNLNERKNKGEDLLELLVEGMDWCTDHGYPEDFWGDIE